MAQKNPKHVWFDGSFRRNGDLGVAWVTKDEAGKLVGDARIIKIDLKEHKPHGSHYAELVACFHALKALDDTSNVVAHTNSEDLIHWMQTGKEAFAQRKFRERLAIEPLRRAFEFALTQQDRMQSVSYERTSDKNNEGMKLAHILAQTASTPSVEPDKKPEAPNRPASQASPKGGARIANPRGSR